jgi:hypothetical protein
MNSSRRDTQALISTGMKGNEKIRFKIILKSSRLRNEWDATPALQSLFTAIPTCQAVIRSLSAKCWIRLIQFF